MGVAEGTMVEYIQTFNHPTVFINKTMGSESKFIWMRFLNSDQRQFFGAESIIAAKAVIT